VKKETLPAEMLACVWRGGPRVCCETVPVPPVAAGELLVRVEACGLCPTDIKKIDQELLSPPVILGHEMAGEVVACGPGAESFRGKRVALYHHVPCRACRLCELGLYSQCADYKRTGTTAGFTPAGGGWAEYVKVASRIVRGGGVVELPPGLPIETAILMEPLNTCLKCLRTVPRPLATRGADTLVVLGQGPVGLMVTALANAEGWDVWAVEPVPERQAMARRFGARQVFSPGEGLVHQLREAAGPLGPDAACAATDSQTAVNAALRAVRFGGTVVLFGHTRIGQQLTIDGGQIGKDEKRLVGSYSSSIDLNDEVCELLLAERIPWRDLVTHVFPLEDINSALDRARRPVEGSLKIAVGPPRRQNGRSESGTRAESDRKHATS
jgi:L-iditol 2-dehydrogenase